MELRGDRVVLRPTRREDLPRLWELLEDLEVMVLSMGGPVLPVSFDQYVEWYEKSIVEPRPDLIRLVVEVDGEVVGQCQLHRVDHFNRRCELGIELGREYWGKGYGQDAVRTLVEYAFVHLDMNRVGLQVLADDPRAVGAYARAGFVEEGRLRRHALVEGAYRDELVMSILREDWRGRDAREPGDP
jgi:RimJ/RimL family protein N-acetyltransferase